MEEFFDPFMDHNEDQKEYKTLKEIEEDIQDLTWDETKATCEIEERVPNANERFPCKRCNQTFSKKSMNEP